MHGVPYSCTSSRTIDPPTCCHGSLCVLCVVSSPWGRGGGGLSHPSCHQASISWPAFANFLLWSERLDPNEQLSKNTLIRILQGYCEVFGMHVLGVPNGACGSSSKPDGQRDPRTSASNRRFEDVLTLKFLKTPSTRTMLIAALTSGMTWQNSWPDAESMTWTHAFTIFVVKERMLRALAPLIAAKLCQVYGVCRGPSSQATTTIRLTVVLMTLLTTMKTIELCAIFALRPAPLLLSPPPCPPLPSFLPSFLPPFHPSLPPSFLPSLIPSSHPCFLAPLLPSFLPSFLTEHDVDTLSSSPPMSC